MLSLEERNDISPICPYCKSEIHVLCFRELKGFLGRRYIYFCPNCKQVLGVSHRKGFFMG